MQHVAYIEAEVKEYKILPCMPALQNMQHIVQLCSEENGARNVRWHNIFPKLSAARKVGVVQGSWVKI